MYSLQKRKKDDHSDSALLFCVHAVLLPCRARKSRLIDWAIIALVNEHPSRHMNIPDYAYDKHNQKGRAMGRGWDHSFTEGTKLGNHTPVEGEDEFKTCAYESKMHPKPPLDYEKKPVLSG